MYQQDRRDVEQERNTSIDDEQWHTDASKVGQLHAGYLNDGHEGTIDDSTGWGVVV